MNIDTFKGQVREYYSSHKRSLPWRETITPYGVFLSEIMLQQTQVPRVLTKYTEFMSVFPSFAALAAATVPQVLAVWQGMGYNRRGLYLRQAAQMIEERFQGRLPKAVALVDELPGVGLATASAMVTYTYNLPTVFIETNIRRVFIHHFFADSEGVADTELYPLVKAALDHENPREWYYALMDYGTFLAKTVPNPNRRSKHYAVQSQFQGSVRQVRGEILRVLLKEKALSYDQLKEQVNMERFDEAIQGLVNDGMVQGAKSLYKLAD